MKKIQIDTTSKKLLADIYTPVGIYLRLRDKFRDTILLESTDFHVAENSFSFIGINAIGGIEISNMKQLEFKLPGRDVETITFSKGQQVSKILGEYIDKFEIKGTPAQNEKIAQGLFGYTSFDAVQFYEDIVFATNKDTTRQIPLVRYRLYQYVIVINHFKDELFICENHIQGIESQLAIIEGLIKNKDVPVYPFKAKGDETSNITDAAFIEMVEKGIASCLRGDVFQIVLSRRFEQQFTGDEFNVYRALRNINPSPYLFYFDYGDYRIMGSSPESQVIVKNNVVTIHPIAGTFKRTGDDILDAELAEKLKKDEKENAEHIMLVDLARNDLSRVCEQVEVSRFCNIQYYSHVIHLVSEVKGNLEKAHNPFEILGASFPAGTLSGAPKYKAMQLIDKYETTSRSYYGGCIGYVGFDGSINHAIMIRSFLSQANTLVYQAGAGIVAASKPQSELEEVNNKLRALKTAIQLAEKI
jgi:anthranilate synthase component I